MRVSDKGLVEIAEHEGIVPAPYRDSVGVWTYGVGHTAAAGGLDPREMNSAMPTGAALDAAVDRALELFKVDLGKYEKRVNDAIKVPLLQHEFDALVSFDFNTGGIYRAKLTAAINAGDKSGAGFMGWLSPPEIRKRRTAEMNLFKTGDYDANGNTVPIWKTNGAGKLIGLHGSMSGSELLLRLRGSVQPDMAVTVPDDAPRVWWLELIMRIFGR
jgi:lysozyme